MIDEGIETVLKGRNKYPIGSLTAQDLFYVEVTKIHELLRVFSNFGDEQIQRKQNGTGISAKLLDIGTIILVN